MGAVYQAKDLKRQVICAVKEMSLSMVPPDERPQAIQNFKIEAKMLWGLSHPNIPALYGYFSEAQRYYLVMEYVDGMTLEELLERNNGPFQERRVLGWARQLCDVLEFLHSQRPPIIFRDLKPGNVMLTRTGRIKLIDFGIARFFRPTISQDTQLLGTPGFAPPEQYGKAQTDERSDIYSLAITLFQLLTNSLSENGFGLKDVRAFNPAISPTVARALEKAAFLNPDDRYENVAAFKRALLGVGTFIFENGDLATTPDELADLCARYPDEASDYLEAGEIELWLQEIGESDLARTARRIRATDVEPEEAVEQFIQAVLGPKAHTRGRAAQISQSALNDQTGKGARVAPRSRPSRSVPQVIVNPRTLDFGQIYPGITPPLALTIAGHQGLLVRGLIRTTEPWILIDHTQFDGMSTRVNVRVNSTLLRGGIEYSGMIIISPDEDDNGQQEITVTVEAEVLGYAQNGSPPRRRAKTHGADLDDDEDDDLSSGSIPTIRTKAGQVQIGVPVELAARDEEYKKKYGPPGTKGITSGWDPLQTTPLQRLWMQRGLTFSAALMVASLFYTFFSHLPAFVHSPPLAPNPWFVVVLAGIVPFAAFGALVVNWNGSRRELKDMINRFCTGAATTLVVVSLLELLWISVIHANAPVLQFIVMLMIAALAAVYGISRSACDYIIYGTSWVLVRLRQVFIGIAGALGGFLALLLGIGLALSWGTFIAIIIGIGIGLALVLRVDYLIQQQNAP